MFFILKSMCFQIHFDGHADDAPPEFDEKLPFFQWPTKENMNVMLQKNDIFIQVCFTFTM